MRFVVLGLSLSLSILGAQVAQAQDAQSWCKSKWGSDDEKGATNLLSPQLVLEAAKLVKTGKVYPLGLETNSKTPAFPPRTFNITVLQPGQTGRRQPWAHQDDLQRRHHHGLGRHRLATRRPWPHRDRQRLLQLQQGR